MTTYCINLTLFITLSTYSQQLFLFRRPPFLVVLYFYDVDHIFSFWYFLFRWLHILNAFILIIPSTTYSQLFYTYYSVDYIFSMLLYLVFRWLHILNAFMLIIPLTTYPQHYIQMLLTTNGQHSKYFLIFWPLLLII